jgi:hypothetical protein
MNKGTKTISIGVVTVLLLAIAGFAVYHLRNQSEKAAAPKAEPTPSSAAPSARASEPVWKLLAALAYLDLHPPAPPSNSVAYAGVFDTSPEQTLQAIGKRITLVPYEGSLSAPADLLATGVANSLDRAQLLQAVLKSANMEARIVSLPQDGKSVSANYPAATPANLAQVKPDVLEALKKEVAEASPLVLAKLKSQKGNWGASLTGAKMEKRLYWVQYQKSGVWVDLLPEDTTVPESKRTNAQILSPEDLTGLEWQVKLTVTNSFTSGQPDQDVLTFSAPASDLNGAALTFLNRPDDAQKQFVPSFFYGNKTVTGTSFAAKQNDVELDHQLLKIDVTGPSSTRHFERVLVGPKGAANDSERLLEIATQARITVLTRTISDSEFERSITGNLIQCAHIAFGKTAPSADAPAANFVSPASIAVLDVSHRAAGLGDAGRQLLAFQGRPALAMEHDFVAVDGNALERHHSLDLIDPGHSLYVSGTGATKDLLIQAAIEQSVVDAWLEERVTSGKKVVTSRSAVHDLLTSTTPLNINKPPATQGSDKYGTTSPVYLLGAITPGKAAGWRFDPGPQMVPVLWNYTGGTESADTPVKRVEKLCNAIPTAMWFVPTEAFPPKFLMGGLVKYDCALAQAYVTVANKIDLIAQQISGDKPANPGPSDTDLQKMINELGPDLVKNILLNALGQTASGLAVEGLKGEGEHASTSREIINYLIGVGADALSDKAADKLKEYLDEIQKSQQEGKSPEQIEQDIAKDHMPH